jgi:uncharacterized RDD family membrane protein YckC
LGLPNSATLDLPAEGAGSRAGTARRIAALAVDWGVSLAVVGVLSGGSLGVGAAPQEANRSAAVVLAVFAVEVAVFTWLTGGSLGQRFLGCAVASLDGRRVGLVRSILRTALVCLVIPAVIFDGNSRGLHDRWLRTVVVRTR